MYMKKLQENVDPEVKKRIAFKRRCQFRALVRLTIENRYWLEDMDDEELGEDVKKNILLLLRKKKGKKMLTLEDKGLLRKNAAYRTNEEIDRIFKIIGSFKCFRRYPNHVKLKLAGVSYFMYFGPGRVIVRQDQEAHALYFILEGEVAVIQEKFDPIKNEIVLIDKGTMGPGQLFGEVSLLHDIPRTATIKTISHCEFLCLYRSDFNFILKNTLQGEWNKILDAMAGFNYFEQWDDVSLRECCIISKIVEYEAGEFIFGHQMSTNSVFFIVEGSCRMIEYIPVVVTKTGTKKHYRRMKQDQEIRWDYEFMRKPTAIFDDQNRTSKSKLSELARGDSSEGVSFIKINRSQSKEKSVSQLEVRPSKSKRVTIGEEKDQTSDGGSLKELDATLRQVIDSTRNTASIVKVAKPSNAETIFMQVCIFNKTACFGLEENLQNRCIVAITPVKVLQIPKYFVWQHNVGNIWQRVGHYLDKHIPSSEEVFKIFVRDREWGEYKRKLVTSLAKRSPINTYSNVPLSIRINYHPDSYYLENDELKP